MNRAFERVPDGRILVPQPYSHAGPFRTATYNLLRIMAGLTFMQHGAMKLFGAFGGMGPSHGTVPLVSLMGLAGVIEFFGGLLIAIGLFTRPVAFLAAGEMATAFFMAHFPKAFFPIQNGGELPVLFCFIWLFFAAHGAGSWSLDAMIARRRDRDPLDIAAGS
jgi:putative oxidoreductase